jgi:transcriptional regulator with XRE-family HTH domain
MLVSPHASVNNYGMAIEWNVGDVIRKLRQSANLTQEQLADLTDLRPATISAIETTGNYKPETLKAIAKALQVSLADIYSLIPDKTPKPTSPADSICPDNNPDHISYHQEMEKILHEYPVGERITPVALSALRAMIEAASGPAPEGDHGSFRPTDAPRPGIDQVEFVVPVPKRKRK